MVCGCDRSHCLLDCIFPDVPQLTSQAENSTFISCLQSLAMPETQAHSLPSLPQLLHRTVWRSLLRTPASRRLCQGTSAPPVSLSILTAWFSLMALRFLCWEKLFSADSNCPFPLWPTFYKKWQANAPISSSTFSHFLCHIRLSR